MSRSVLRTACLLAVIGLIATSVPYALNGDAAPGSEMTTVNGVAVDGAIASIWGATDGPVAAHNRSRAWVWGPAALAATAEYSSDSPTGVRHMVYFDKGRMDILDGAESPDSPWYVTGALLVTQMLSGKIPYSVDGVVRRTPPAIPVAGDLDQPDPLTYATLASTASVDGWNVSGLGVQGSVGDSRVGEPVTDLISPNGAVTAGVADSLGITVGSYDPITGHNVAEPFLRWSTNQGVDALWLTGRPLTEPLWLDTVIGGESTRILVQAFERRILTYAPGQPSGWNVESNNAGAHYRLWRGLVQPNDAGDIAIADGELFGEEIVGAATQRGVDPLLVAAIVHASSGGDPMATQSNGGVGLMAVRPEKASELGGGDLHDPRLNTLLGTSSLTRLLETSDGDISALLTAYYKGADTDLDVAELAATTVTTYDDLRAIYGDGDDKTSPVPTAPDGAIAAGQAAYYAQSYDRTWWERTLQSYAWYGLIAPNWANDPNGYYCVRPGYIPGQVLRLQANGVEITCTIGDTVATGDISSWYQHWAIELNWDAFIALGLDHSNQVNVYQLGPVG